MIAHSGDIRSPRQLLAAFHQAMLAKSADDLADLHAEDAVYEFPLLTPGRPERYVGREEIRQGFGAAWAAAPVRVTDIIDVVVHETSDPQVLIAEQKVVAVITDNGHRFQLPFLLILWVEESKIVRTRDYADALRGALELGRLPALVDRLSNR